jgi:hypothetical protein
MEFRGTNYELPTKPRDSFARLSPERAKARTRLLCSRQRAKSRALKLEAVAAAAAPSGRAPRE